MSTQATKKRILFVDDELSVLDGMKRLLRSKRKEWELSFAEGVDDALEVLESAPFDAVVSDINMPRRDGFDLLRTIREHAEWGAIPVVILTGNGESGLKRKALDLGATDLLNKPVDFDDLVARVHSVLRLKAYDDEIKAHNRTLEEKIRERTAQLEMSQVELIWRLGKAGEFRDSDTGYHVVRVGFYARQLAMCLGLDLESQRTVFLTAPLHDIGKIGVPDSILLKPDKLTNEEWVTMRTHTTMGARILKDEVVAKDKIYELGILAVGAVLSTNNILTEVAASIAEAHHERWDGGGYPHGLAGKKIPLEARITSVADVYDALCSKRPYKDPFSEEQVIEIMTSGKGTQFDPEVLEAFQESVSAFREIRDEFDDDRIELPHADVALAIMDLKKAS